MLTKNTVACIYIKIVSWSPKFNLKKKKELWLYNT